MRILMLLEHHYPTDIRVEKEIDSLLKEGYQVILACSTRKGEDESIQTGNLTIVRKKMSKFIYKSSVGVLKFPFYFRFWRRFIKQILAEYKIELIHIHDLPLALLGLELKKKHNLPFILDSHENYPYMLAAAAHTQTLLGKLLSSHKQWLGYEKKMLKGADAVLSVIDEQKERFCRLGITKKKLFIVSNTPVYQQISSTMPQPPNFTYVYAGNIYATKGLDIMVKAFQKVNQQYPGTNLWIIGDAKKWQETDRQLNKNIKLWGWQNLDELLQIIAGADVALLPHLKNMNSDFGIPNKLFQYMMAGKPVIAANCNPIKRIIAETKAGLIYQYDDTQDLSQKMIRLLENRQLTKKMGLNGHKAVKDKYNWQKEETNLLSAYRHAVNSQPK